MSAHRPPVTDWASDFDHTDPEWVADPYPIWDELRETCPVAHTDRYGGTWLPVRNEDVAAGRVRHRALHVALGDRQRAPPGRERSPGADRRRARRSPPTRRSTPTPAGCCCPRSGPKAVAGYEQFTRDLCRELLDEIAGQGRHRRRGRLRAAHPGARHREDARLPAGGRGHLPRVHPPRHRRRSTSRAEEREAQFEASEIDEYLDARIEEHLPEPRDDLTTFLLEAELDGNKLHPDHVRGTIVLLMIAGIDTTWSAIGASLWHLAQHPEDRRRLGHRARADDHRGRGAPPRAYAPVTMARMVAEDFEFQGCPFKKDDWVLLPFPAANRDPEAFPDADEVVLDRAVNRHSAFGLGIHRCLGSNLARMELRVALEEWIARYPDFELADPSRGHLVGRPGPRPAHGPRPHPVTRSGHPRA